jgi:peptide deformylase
MDKKTKAPPQAVKKTAGNKAILQSDDPILHQHATAIPVDEIKSPKIQKVIRQMINALESEDDGVGLAAPQIGHSLRIFIVAGFVFDRLKKTTGCPHEIFINPVITKESKEKKWLDGEGCLSVRWFYGKVYRSTRVTLEAYNEKGEKRSRGSSGLLAHIFQHEVDHLNGILFTDKARDLQEFDPAEIKAETARSRHGHFNTPKFGGIAPVDTEARAHMNEGANEEDDFNPEV